MTKVYTKVYTLSMTTKLIGIKDFRQNIAKYAKRAQSKIGKERLVVMNRNKPLFEIRPFEKETEIYSDEFIAGILEAKRDIEAGRVYTHEELLKEFSK